MLPAIAIVSAVFSPPAFGAMLCGPYFKIRTMIVRQMETLANRNLSERGDVAVELFLRQSEDGGISYSLLAQSPNGLTCLIVSSFYIPPFLVSTPDGKKTKNGKNGN